MLLHLFKAVTLRVGYQMIFVTFSYKSDCRTVNICVFWGGCSISL